MDYLRLEKEQLKGLNDLLVMRRKGGPINMIGHSPTEGIVSARMDDGEAQDTLEFAAKAIDAGSLRPGGVYKNLPYPLNDYFINDFRMLNEELHPAILEGDRRRGSGALPDDITDQIISVVHRAIPAQALSVLRQFDNLHERFLSDAFAYLSSGDVEARVQALQSFPMLSEFMIWEKDMMRIIDARGSLGEKVSEMSRMSAGEFRRYSRIERDVGFLMFGTEPNLRMSEILKNFNDNRQDAFRRTVEGYHLSQMRTAVIEAARQTRNDQIPPPARPGSGNAIYRSPSLWVALTVDALAIMESRLALGPEPVRRLLKGVRSEDWSVEHSLAQRLQRRDLSGTEDYVSHARHVISNAVIMSHVKDHPEINLERIERTANMLIADEQPPDEDVAELTAYISEMEDEILPLRAGFTLSLNHEIGDNVSLKRLGELNTRWHHNSDRLHHMMMGFRQNFEWRPLSGNLVIDVSSSSDQDPSDDLIDTSLQVREICSTDQMTEQGQKEDHCVGGYSRNVLSASEDFLSVIFSIERLDGTIVSTVEMQARLEDGKWHWYEEQNMAAKNASPHDDALEAAEILEERLSALPHQAVQDYITGIRSSQSAPRQSLIQFINHNAANLTNPNLAEVSLREFDKMLPHALRGRTASDWLEPLAVGSDRADEAVEDLPAAIDRLAEVLREARNEVKVEHDLPGCS